MRVAHRSGGHEAIGGKGRGVATGEGHMKARTIIAALAILGCLAGSGCVSYPDKAYWEVHDARQVGSRSQLMAIEVSEKGAIFHPEQRERMRRWLGDESTREPIVVFVNGWHHDASQDDRNLRDFTGFLGKLESRLDEAGVPVDSVDGLYVGWRGDEYDLRLPAQWLDFPTIWPRKRASTEVGRNGLKEIVAILQELQGRQSARPLVIIGHSLGGSALFQAMRLNLSGPALDGSEYIMLNPAVSELEFEGLQTELKNAFAAQRAALAQAEGTAADTAEYQRQREFLDRDYRKLVVLQAQGDTAVGFLHRLAFKGTPIGFSESRQTHTAQICGIGAPCPETDWRGCQRTVPARVPAGRAGFLITARGADAEECRESTREPVWVIAGRDTVSRSHNDIFNDVQADALAALVVDSIERQARR